jgi:hypothetical protein
VPYVLAVDPFVLIVSGLVGGLLLALVALGLFYPGSGAAQLDWRPTRSAELEVQNEIDDLDQMLEAANERRRRRGEVELTEEGLHAEVRADLREQVRRRDDYMAELEIAQMLDATNEKRRARGERDLTIDELRTELGE